MVGMAMNHCLLKITLDPGKYVGFEWLIRENWTPLPHKIGYAGCNVRLKMETQCNELTILSEYQPTIQHSKYFFL